MWKNWILFMLFLEKKYGTYGTLLLYTKRSSMISFPIWRMWRTSTKKTSFSLLVMFFATGTDDQYQYEHPTNVLPTLDIIISPRNVWKVWNTLGGRIFFHIRCYILLEAACLCWNLFPNSSSSLHTTICIFSFESGKGTPNWWLFNC